MYILTRKKKATDFQDDGCLWKVSMNIYYGQIFIKKSRQKWKHTFSSRSGQDFPAISEESRECLSTGRACPCRCPFWSDEQLWLLYWEQEIFTEILQEFVKSNTSYHLYNTVPNPLSSCNWIEKSSDHFTLSSSCFSIGQRLRSNVKTVFVAHLTTKMLSCIRNLLKREISQDVCNVPCPIKRNNDLNKLV